MLAKIAKYAKFVAAALGAVAASLETVGGAPHWLTVITAVATAVSVYLVPNKTV